MKQMGQDFKEEAPIFEINPEHAIIKKLQNMEDKEKLKDLVNILFDSARLLEKGSILDATNFSDRLNRFIESNI